ncbi:MULTISPECIES: exopolysaccharide biosynthesis protein [unclassified Chelatococcus]|uniref:exopolysaccharide biosynthesis protein n=1 Tax=unclassified Chelatococcus TaxID=2638111 RepID=UPI001BD0CC69|nr:MULTISPECIES: exopolysaccharide biosynthesis protein [unclassified Chelatococcus]MBS7695902.1 exopolysaccharide biosynthesis protein [Chelatococcus sp. YT9]MBX3555723.1 exopolysaccharide biosynthesis protein [Chelatococcus sp.]
MHDLSQVPRDEPRHLGRLIPVPTAANATAEHEPVRLSAILKDIAEDASRDRISLRDLLTIGRDRAFGALLFIFAVPNVMPAPPGMSAILGLPLLFLAAQLMVGYPHPWLPKIIADRSMRRQDFATLINKLAPWIARSERLLKPRLSLLAITERFIGLVALCLAIILFLPIPLGNMLPALAICFFALGILERDGIAVLLGYATTIVSAVVVSGVLYALIKSALFILSNAF